MPSYILRRSLPLGGHHGKNIWLSTNRSQLRCRSSALSYAVYNDWIALDPCLRSLAQQTHGPSFEVIVVDDGSSEAAPEVIRQWARCLPLTIVRQSHAGISAARNHGIQISRGSVLLFVDADCRLQTDCLAALGSTITASPQHNCFQLHLCRRLLGVRWPSRRTTAQNVSRSHAPARRSHSILEYCRIRHSTNSGVNIEEGLFDPVALRAEDTLLLANLMQGGELPLFVANATVQHAIPLSLMECFLKDIRSAYLEGRTYDIIASQGSKNSSQSSGASESAVVHVEDFRTTFHWKVGVVCACSQANAATDCLFCVPTSRKPVPLGHHELFLGNTAVDSPATKMALSYGLAKHAVQNPFQARSGGLHLHRWQNGRSVLRDCLICII